MAITPATIKFANEKTRVSADNAAQHYHAAKVRVAEWEANPDMQPPNDGTVIEDGSHTNGNPNPDGRHPITGSDMHNMINRDTEFIADLEANSNAKLNTILNVAVNPIR